MQEIAQLLANPLVIKLLKWLLAYWVFSAAVGALPMPQEGGHAFYRWAFAFLHGISGNVSRALIALKVPGAQ
jgi:hypothetical protein